MTLEREEDYDALTEGARLRIDGLYDAVKSADRVEMVCEDTGRSIGLKLTLTERQREILLAGGTLNYTKLQK